MKKKHIKKIAKVISNMKNKVKEDYGGDKEYDKQPSPLESDGFNTLDYDEEISDKFYEFISNLMEIEDRLNITIEGNCISIYSDMDSFNIPSTTNQSSTSNSKKLRPSEDILNVMITSVGFRISRQYSQQAFYKDDKMFDRLNPVIIEKNKIRNKNLMIKIIDDVMIKTNLVRNINLDKLLE